ncbi:MAG: HIT family protein [Candidatus Sigynarchaeota archaeon]
MAKQDGKKNANQDSAAEDCVFCKIVAGKIPSRKFYEDDAVIGILDINPVSSGHSLIIPKEHFKLIMDGTDKQIQKTFVGVKNVADRLKNRLGFEGFNMLVNQGREAGQVINHFHVHVIPRVKGDGLHVHPPERKVTDAELDQVFAKLK